MLARVVAFERLIVSRGQYERVGGWSIRVYDRSRERSVLVSLVHRYLDIVRLVADAATYFTAQLRSYHVRAGTRLTDIRWDPLYQNFFRPNAELAELI